MADVINTGAVIQATDTNGGLKPDAYYSTALLEMLRNATFVHRKYLKKQSHPKNYGNVINFRRYNKLSIAATALTEAVPPDGVAMTGTSTTATLYQYGNVIKSSDLVDLEHLDDLKREYGRELANNAAETLDYIAREALISEASDYYAQGTESTRPTDLDEMTAKCTPSVDDFRRCALAMQAANIRPVGGANGKYVCIVDSTVMFDLLDDSKLEDKFMLAGKTNAPIVDNQIYEIYNLRFEVINNAKAVYAGAYEAPATHGSLTAVYSLILGNEAAAEVDLSDAGVQMYTKPLGSAGTDDPLNQVWSMGWKINGFAVKVLTPLAVYAYASIPTQGALKRDAQAALINP